jgi:hypothetical protein
LTTTWSLQSGPGTVTFGDASVVDTTATFSTIGTYLLKLEATDGQFTTAGYVHIVVDPLTTSLTATADTYIDTRKATTNFGSAATLTADGKPDLSALLKWDLSSIATGSTLQSVKLSINVTGTSPETFEIYELKRSWTESQATWKKANSSTNWQSAGAKGALDRGSTVLGTVNASATGIRTVTLNAAGLAVVQGWVENPATNFGFVIQDYANTTDDDLIFSARETTVSANRPQLQVVYAPPSTAPMSFGLSASTAESTLVVDSAMMPSIDAKRRITPASSSPTLTAAAEADLRAAALMNLLSSSRPKLLVDATGMDENDPHEFESETAATDLALTVLSDAMNTLPTSWIS